ncbi:MAG: sigma-54-dependent Fis family transcriptional regulator [Spirochaetaceae bacterium]|nr:MAG: sigma-54-dependent Fis family transcriptional regulator [Spirochaetaceae bacterium]
MKTILVIDDERGIRDVLSDILQDEGYNVITAEDGLVGLGLLERELVDCLLLDVWLPGRGGMDVLEEVKRLYSRIPVIMISGHGTIDMAVKAVKGGAFDFIEKPLSLDRVTTVVRHALEMESLRQENETLRKQVALPDRSRLIGTSPAIQAIRKIIRQIGESDARVMITGENGTGKELVAREIHHISGRRNHPFVAVNCAALPETLIESELFGHEKGAFTGAYAGRKGKFEHAHGGTLFLDEIADMSPGAQAKVLRVIQEMQLQRLGGEETISVDVRVIAATNKDISREVREGRFREDLFFRLNVVPLHMPALRDRAEDIPLLLDALVREQDREMGFSPEAIQKITEYSWPGNVRELKNFAERVSILIVQDTVTREDVDRLLGSRGGAAQKNPLGEYLQLGLSDARDSFERTYLMEKLREHDNNVSQTAQSLGIYPSSLHAKIRKLGIEVGR